MAPSRKRGVNKAAAAAAACRKWKVGDLVLAKVKGYPAWPATVSEPEKWNQAADKKKVFVHFFGTGQIASCHPVDVEEFTEEKKSSLLGKRHGKGADFIRAVKEISDCLENVKQQDKVSTIDGTEETSITTEQNSKESLTKLEKDVAPAVTVKSHATGTANDLNSLTEAAVAAAAEDVLHHEDLQMELAHSNVLFTETPMPATYPTTNKSDVAQSQNGTQRRISTRKLTRSSGADANRLQNLMLPSVNGTRSSRHSGSNSLRDRFLRSKRFMKSSDDSEGCDSDSPSSTSNDSGEENDSGTMTVDSDIHSYNDGSSVESGCKPVETELACDNNDGETELNDRFDFQNKTVIIKKKRKPSRKRHSTDTVVTAKPNVVLLDSEVLKPECVSLINNGKLVKRPKGDGEEQLPMVISPKNDGDEHLPLIKRPKDDGDEHLPLLKRARIRMGRPSTAEEQENVTVHKEEKVSVLGTQLSGSFNRSENDPADGNFVPVKGDPPNFSLSHQSPPKKPQFWESSKKFVDGEAALPPSKRLHRALEAMSANVAENSYRASSCSPIVKTHSNEYSSSFPESSELVMEKKAGTESGPVEDHKNGDSQSSASDFCVGSNSELSGTGAKTFVVVSYFGKTCSVDSSDSKLNKDSFEHEEGAGSTRVKSSPLNDLPVEIGAANQHVKLSPLNEHPTEIVSANQHVKQGSPISCEELVLLDCNTPGLVISPTASCKIEGSELNNAAKGPDPAVSHLSISAALLEQIAGGSLDMDIDTQATHLADKGCEAHKKKYPPLADTNQTSQRSESKEEVKPLSPTPVNASANSYGRSRLHTDSVSDKTCSVAKASPPSSSMHIISQSESNNYIENSISCSSNVQLHLEKAKLAGKSSSKVEFLSSFEAAIRSLTRTKESIGRATRIAIDCAKFGFATKVVETLALGLERESSSHKKVDLFFLVDSITQFSRGVKGDGGVYPSAIQALLPRLLLAAAPPGSSSHENHRQCLKVLRVWQERKIIPEPIIRHHIQELDALCGSYPTGGSRRSLRNERAFDDPIREMEGMVDEYGSNSSFQLPGFCMPPMLRDDDGGTDSDGESFEAVTPEHNVENPDAEKTPVPAVEKRSHILEDVDGELEMEDVAPCFEVEMTSTDNITGTDCMQLPHDQPDTYYGAVFAPQQSKDIQLASAPLPMSLPPPPPPPHPIPPSVFPPSECDSMANGPESKHYPSSQNFHGIVRESMTRHSVFPRTKQTTLNSTHYRTREYRDFEAHVPRHMPDGTSFSFNDRATSHSSERANGIHQADSAFSKGFHLRPPHPAPSNQFSYVQEQISQSHRDMPPPPHPNRFHMRNAENGNFYRDRNRNKFVPRDNIGECWRPPLPSMSGPCYQDGGRMPHASTTYGGPSREPAAPNNRLNYRPRSMNHRHFNHYRTPSEGPIPVENRGTFWRPR